MLKSIPLSILLALLTQVICAQIPVLRTPNDTSQIDSAKFPIKPYHKVVSYSINRNRVDLGFWRKKIRQLKKDLSELKNKKDSRAYFRVSTELSYAKYVYRVYQYKLKNDITNSYGWEKSVVVWNQVAPSAEQFKTLSTTQIDTLNAIIQRPTDSIVTTLCVPVYRDGLVFYDKNDIIMSHIDICFHCTYLKINSQDGFKMSMGKWQQLKKYFKESLGHPINE